MFCSIIGLTIASILISFSLPARAAAIAEQPDKCPDIAKIQQSSFIYAKVLSDGHYGALQLGNYGTSYLWGFLVSHIAASTVDEAMNKAASALGSLGFDSGPTYYPQSNLWACIYTLDSGYLAAALTPLPYKYFNKSIDYAESALV